MSFGFFVVGRPEGSFPSFCQKLARRLTGQPGSAKCRPGDVT